MDKGDKEAAQGASYALLKALERTGHLDGVLGLCSDAELREIRGNVTEHLTREGKQWGPRWNR